MCYQVRFITRSVKCMVTMRWVMACFGNGLGCSMKDVHEEARSGRPSLVNDDLVRKFNERARDDRRFTISDLPLHFPQISRTVLHDIVSNHLGYRRPHSMRRVYKVMCSATISASIMAANMWKNSLKNVESDDKILYETLLDFFTAKRHLLSE